MRYGSYEVLRVGSCATGSREPSQVRKEAALSGPSRVPQGCLTRAEDEYDLVAPGSTAGARSPDSSLAHCEPGYPARGRSLAGECLGELPLGLRRRGAPDSLVATAVRRTRLATARTPGAGDARAPLRSPRAPEPGARLGDLVRRRALRCARGCGDGRFDVAGARHERRRCQGPGIDVLVAGAAQGAERRGDRGRARRERERHGRSRDVRPGVDRHVEDQDRERLPGSRGERLSWRHRDLGARRRCEAAARSRGLGHQLGGERRLVGAAVGHGRRRADRGPQRHPGPRGEPGLGGSSRLSGIGEPGDRLGQAATARRSSPAAARPRPILSASTTSTCPRAHPARSAVWSGFPVSTGAPSKPNCTSTARPRSTTLPASSPATPRCRRCSRARSARATRRRRIPRRRSKIRAQRGVRRRREPGAPADLWVHNDSGGEPAGTRSHPTARRSVRTPSTERRTSTGRTSRSARGRSPARATSTSATSATTPRHAIRSSSTASPSRRTLPTEPGDALRCRDHLAALSRPPRRRRVADRRPVER